jgi:hypothetical protein
MTEYPVPYVLRDLDGADDLDAEEWLEALPR